MASRKLEVEIVGDSRSLERAFGRSSSAASRFGSGLRTLGRVAAVGVGAAFAGLAVTLKRGFDELSEGQKVAAQTAAALKSTGGVANVTAKDIEELAESLSRMTGIDDEAVQANENLLLTFKNVRNEVGKGNDIFNRATEASLDLSTAGFGSLESSAKMLGKALNDPIKGMTALGRAGVTFSEEQKEAIKALVESGHALEAQKLILKEVESQVGGSAKAYGETLPGQLAKARNAFDEVAGNVAAKFLPMLTSVLDWVNQHWPEIEAVINAGATAIIKSFEAIGVVVTWLKGQWEIHQGTVKRTWATIQTSVQGVVRWFQQNVVPAIRNVVTVLKTLWSQFGDTIKSVLRTDLAVALTVLKTWIQNMLAPFKVFLAVLRGDWSGAWNEIKATFSRTIGAILTIMRGAFDNFLAIGKGIMKNLFDGIKAIWENIRSWFSGLGGRIKSAIGDLRNLLWEAGWQVLDGFYRGLLYMWDKIKSLITSIAGWIGANKGPLSKDRLLLRPHGRAIMAGFEAGLQQGWQPITKMVAGMAPALAYPTAPTGSSASQPAPVGWGSSPTVHVENMHVRNDRDIELIAARVAQRLALR